jgi:signal transduction histidine kinase
MVREGPANVAPTPSGLTFNSVTLKWRAALLFTGQLILVAGGVLALLLIQQDQQRAVVSTDSARRAQVLEAAYFAGMVEAESGLQEYLDTGDSASLVQYRGGLSDVVATGSALRLVEADAAERLRLDQMFAAAYAWQHWAAGALISGPSTAPGAAVGDDLFASYTYAQQGSTGYLETVVTKAAAAEVDAVNREILALAAIGIVALVSVIAGGVLVYRSTLQPMGRLIRTARELAAGARTELPPSTAAGEIGDLSRALHAWQRFLEKRAAVMQAMHAVSGRVDRDEMVQMGLEKLLEVSDADEVGVILIDAAGTVVTRMTSASGLQEPLVLPPGSPFEALLVSAANLVGDGADDSWPEEIRAWAAEGGFGPLAVVPMVSGSKPVGAIAAARSIGRPGFDEVDVSLIEAIAGPLAAAIRVAALFDEVSAVSAQLDLANRHKTDFMSNMSHELRTPLNSILGFAELLTAPGFDAVTAKQARYIANIHASGTHLASLLNDALDLAKVESGKTELELERVDVGSLVSEVMAAMQPLAIAAQVRLLTSPGRPGTIAADRRKLHQVLLNLLSNAIKFTPPEGSVTVAVRRTDDALIVSVVDTGIGVADEDKERIFGAFEQVAGANRDGGGTGLGLALARQYVELHGGRIWLESGVGQGSSFYISLPVSGAAVRATEAAEVPQMAGLLQK